MTSEWTISYRGRRICFFKTKQITIERQQNKSFFDIFPENVNKMPPKEIREETAMSAKLFLENVIDFNLYEDCKTAEVPWQAVVEGVSQNLKKFSGIRSKSAENMVKCVPRLEFLIEDKQTVSKCSKDFTEF